MSDTENLPELALKALERYLHEQGIPLDEIIDGVPVSEAAEWVDLAIEHTPVIAERCPSPTDGGIIRIPETIVAHETRGGKDYILGPAIWNARLVSSAELKVMRARFLLWRGLIYRTMAAGRLRPYPLQQEALHHFFPDGVFMLAPEILAKAGKP